MLDPEWSEADRLELAVTLRDVGALNVFVIYDDRLARVESETGLLVLRDPTDVRYYLELFAQYQRYALRSEEVQEFLLKIADDFRHEGHR